MLIPYEGPSADINFHFQITRSLHIAELMLTAQSKWQESKRWEFKVPRDGSLVNGPLNAEVKQHIGEVLPGGRFTGIEIQKMFLKDTGIFLRDWARYVTQALAVVTPDGKFVITALRDGRLRVLNAETGQEQGMLVGHATPVTSLVTTQDGRRLVSGSVDGIIKVWDLGANLKEQVLAGHSGPITALAIGPTADLIVSASADGTLKAWDLVTGHEKYTLSGHGDAVLALSLIPEGQTAISASADRTLKVWNLAAGLEEFTLFGHDGPVLSVAVTPDGRHAVSASQDGTLKIWDLDSRRSVHTLSGHSGAVHAIAVTPDSKRVLSVAEDGTLRVWSQETGREVKRFEVDPFSLQLLHSGARLAATRWWSNKLEIWDVTASKRSVPLVFAVLDHELGHLASSSDDETILVGDEMGTVYCLRYVEATPQQ